MILALAAALLVSPAGAVETDRIDWADLIDQAAQEYEDPYRDLTYDQLDDLRTFVRLRARLESGELSDTARPNVEARVAEAEGNLTESGIDIDWLLEQRWVVAERRKAAATAGNPEVDGQVVSIAGFAIPAPADPDGTPVAYLVPERGMCSHVPPPPPNQMVRVRLTPDWQPSVLHEPVLLTGQLTITPTETEFYIVDGLVPMKATFELDATGVVTVEEMLADRESE